MKSEEGLLNEGSLSGVEYVPQGIGSFQLMLACLGSYMYQPYPVQTVAVVYEYLHLQGR